MAGIAIIEQFSFIFNVVCFGEKKKKKKEVKSKLLNHIVGDESFVPYSFGLWGFSSVVTVRFFFSSLFYSMNDNRISIIAFVRGIDFISEIEVFYFGCRCCV